MANNLSDWERTEVRKPCRCIDCGRIYDGANFPRDEVWMNEDGETLCLACYKKRVSEANKPRR
jgi:hypothetical protein